MTTQITISDNALTVKETQPFTALSFTTRTTLQTMAQHAPGVAQNLHQEANRLKLVTVGPIQWIYTGVNGDATNEFQLDIVLPIHQPGEQPNGFSYQVFPAFRCAAYMYKGPWSELGELYAVLFSQLYRDGFQNDGRVREVYTAVDLEDPSNCVTDIQIGLI